MTKSPKVGFGVLEVVLMSNGLNAQVQQSCSSFFCQIFGSKNPDFRDPVHH